MHRLSRCCLGSKRVKREANQGGSKMKIFERIRCGVCHTPVRCDRTRPFGLQVVCPKCPNGGHWQPQSKKDKWHLKYEGK